MAVDDFNPSDLDELATQLRAIEGISADRDAAKVQTPGVWIRFDGLAAGTLASLGVKLTLHAVVATTGDKPRDLDKVAALYNSIKPVIAANGGPTGDITPTGLILPGSTVALPCLQIPLHILTTN